MRIAFTTELPQEGLTRLSAHDLYVPLSEADILVSTFDKPVTAQMIESAPHLRLIANFGAGFNNIDLEACKACGIRVTNTPQPVIEPTAELAFALMVSLMRKVALFDRQLREGSCQPMAVMNNLSNGLNGKTLGIIGLGRIGLALARRAIASGMRVIYHNRHEVAPATMQAGLYPITAEEVMPRYVDRDTLLRESDVVSLNLPYTKDVHHLIGENELLLMKSTAFLLNTARGAHVDEQALIRALEQGQIAGAALDVYEHEPHISEQLLRLDNVVLSPHTGTGTWEGRILMCENVADNILAYINNEPNKMNIVL